MKKILLLLILFYSVSSLTAQEVSVDPNPAYFIETELELLDYSELDNAAVIKNEGSEEYIYGWRKIILSAPEEWALGVRDPNMCYFPEVETSINPVVMAAGEVGPLNVYLFPNGTPGCGTVLLEITPFDDFDNVLYQSTYEFRVNIAEDCTTAVTTSIDDVTISKVRVYPNPTSDLFKISELENIPEAKEVAIYNIVGTKVKSFAPTASQYSVGDLPDGLYMVSLIGDTGILKTVRMSKNSLRP